jgi:hypothetical protein
VGELPDIQPLRLAGLLGPLRQLAAADGALAAAALGAVAAAVAAAGGGAGEAEGGGRSVRRLGAWTILKRSHSSGGTTQPALLGFLFNKRVARGLCMKGPLEGPEVFASQPGKVHTHTSPVLAETQPLLEAPTPLQQPPSTTRLSHYL